MTRPLLWLKVLFNALRSHSNQQFYDRISPIYDQVYTEHKLHAINMANVLDAAYANRKSSTLIMDLGCGTGMLGRILAGRGFATIGQDISLQSLRRLKQVDSRVPVVQSDAHLLPVADNSFDAVVSLGAWRHFPEPDQVMAEISRILRKDGLLIIGYFPPALGGAIHHTGGMLSTLLTSVYQFVTRKLGYVDRPGMSLESETLELASRFFQHSDTVKSGKHWGLIVSSEPVD